MKEIQFFNIFLSFQTKHSLINSIRLDVLPMCGQSSLCLSSMVCYVTILYLLVYPIHGESTLSTGDVSFVLVFLATTSCMEQTLTNELTYEEADG